MLVAVLLVAILVVLVVHEVQSTLRFRALARLVNLLGTFLGEER